MEQHSINMLAQFFTNLARWFERLLALGVLIGVIAHTVYSVFVLAGMDWQLSQTFYDLMAILELLAFVIARKMLKPDILAVEIVLAAAAYVALLAARRYLLVAPSPASHTEGDDLF